MKQPPLAPEDLELLNELLKPVAERLAAAQDILAHFSDDDWKASLMWEALDEVGDKLAQDLSNIMHMPCKPADFVHWRRTAAARQPGFEVF